MTANLLQILILGLVQGAAELLPVSSSAHVIVAEKLLGLDPSAPEMTFLLVMLHTGTMFAVIVYFWKSWRASYFANWETFRRTLANVVVATVATGVVGLVLQHVIERIFLSHHGDKAEVEVLFSQLPLIAIALFAAGVLIIYSGHPRGAQPGKKGCDPHRSGLDRDRPGILSTLSRFFTLRSDHFNRPYPRDRKAWGGGVQFCPCRRADARNHRQGAFPTSQFAAGNVALPDSSPTGTGGNGF